MRVSYTRETHTTYMYVYGTCAVIHGEVRRHMLWSINMTSVLVKLPYLAWTCYVLAKLLINIPWYKLLYIINKLFTSYVTRPSQQVIIECYI